MLFDQQRKRIGVLQLLNGKYLFEWVLFGSLFIYLVIRAIHIPPLHDEVATFFHYVETGDIWSDTAMLDANNHLLNSYLSRFMYLLFGEQFFFLRIPNLIAFLFYFWSIVYILKGLNHRFNYLISLIALNTIPFILEYFALSRGYGLGLAFFVMCIALLFRWVKTTRSVTLYLCLFTGWLSVFSNLIFINSFIILVFLVIVLVLTQLPLNTKQFVLQLSSLVFISILTYPLIEFGLKLKDSGAMYYGSLDGFWQVTGTSLSNFVFFSKSPIIKWGTLTVLIVILIHNLTLLIRLKWTTYLLKNSTFLFILLIGNIMLTFGLAKILNVNYPEDRAGIYFVLLFFISTIYTLDSLNWKFGGVPFLFFPIAFLYTLNFSKTKVTPDQLLSPAFYKEIRAQLKPSSTVQIYPTQSLAWAYYERQQEHKIFGLALRDPSPVHDVVVTRSPFYTADDRFIKQTKDSLTKDYILIQNEELKRLKSKEKEVQIPWNANTFNEITHFHVSNSLYHQNLLFRYQGSIEIDSIYNAVSIVFEALNSRGEEVLSTEFPLRWYFGAKNLTFDFEINHPISCIDNQIQSIKAYISNPYKRAFTINHSKMTVYELN